MILKNRKRNRTKQDYIYYKFDVFIFDDDHFLRVSYPVCTARVIRKTQQELTT